MMKDSKHKVFVDTNILYYANEPLTSFGEQAIGRMKELVVEGHRLALSTQIIREYANSTLRNAIYHKLSLKQSIEDVLYNIVQFHEDFEIFHENEEVLPNWLHLFPLLTTHKDVFDFNIAATLQAHGIRHILTHNTNDFFKFSDWLTILPLFTEKRPT